VNNVTQKLFPTFGRSNAVGVPTESKQNKSFIKDSANVTKSEIAETEYNSSTFPINIMETHHQFFLNNEIVKANERRINTK